MKPSSGNWKKHIDLMKQDIDEITIAMSLLPPEEIEWVNNNFLDGLSGMVGKTKSLIQNKAIRSASTEKRELLKLIEETDNKLSKCK